MFTKKKNHKSLKVGLIQGNRPLIERKLKPKEKVTIGPHPKNTFVIEYDGLPKKFVAFKPQGERYLLYFLPGMKGKIAVKDKAISLDNLVDRGVVETKKGQHSVSISARTRGKIVFGDYRILFRFEDAP